MTHAQSSATIAHLIDHTLLKPEATPDQIKQLCQEARQYGFASVCVHPIYVTLAGQQLQEADSIVCTVAGFPLGTTLPQTKIYETEQAFGLGASEIDMVINIGALKSGDHGLVEADIAGVADMAHRHGGLCKVIIETALLNQQEKVLACQIAQRAGADFVKTSTGFNGGGATVEDIALMRETVGPDMGVKAAGGIKTLTQAQRLVAAGATRLGASAGVQIIKEALS